MATLTYDKQRLVEVIQSEKAKAIESYADTLEEQRKSHIGKVLEEIKRLEGILKKLENKEKVDDYSYRYRPDEKYYTAKYDNALRRLSYCSDETLKLNDKQADEILALLP